MSLLPKAAEEFRNRDYWDQFFTKVGAEAFEWFVRPDDFRLSHLLPFRYSDFVDLASVLCKYIKARDEVLIVGCGNSTLSSDLYDTGIEQITNVDLSEKVIKQMKRQNEKKRPKMNWLPMDARKMTFDDQQFSVVLDKGTIDALMSNRSEQVRRTSFLQAGNDHRFPTGPSRYQSDPGRSGSSASCHRSIHLYHIGAETDSRSSLGTLLPSEVILSRTRR